jgi:hypothetical protein
MTPIDLPETYVGGSQAGIGRILADDRLETIQMGIDARVDFVVQRELRKPLSDLYEPVGRATGAHLSPGSPTLNVWAKLDR